MVSRSSPKERVRWQVRTLTGHSDYVRSVAFSPDATRIVSGSADKLVKIWDAETGAEVGIFLVVFWRWWCGGGALRAVRACLMLEVV